MYIPKVPKCLSPRPNWERPNPSPTSECVPPGTKGGGTHSPAGEGVGREYQFGRPEKKSSYLSTLWYESIFSLIEFMYSSTGKFSKCLPITVFLHDPTRREQIILRLHTELEKIEGKYARPFVITMIKNNSIFLCLTKILSFIKYSTHCLKS